MSGLTRHFITVLMASSMAMSLPMMVIAPALADIAPADPFLATLPSAHPVALQGALKSDDTSVSARPASDPVTGHVLIQNPIAAGSVIPDGPIGAVSVFDKAIAGKGAGAATIVNNPPMNTTQIATAILNDPALGQAHESTGGADVSTAARYGEAKHIRATAPPIQVYQGFGKKNAPVSLTADVLEHDEAAQTVTATGHVELVQSGHILRADMVTYNLTTDTAYAKGSVVISEPNGDVHFADEVQFQHEFGSGFVKGLQSYLASGGRFIAHDGTREGAVTTMNGASYTPCECEEDAKGAPGWQIKAKKMVYHEDTHRIVADDAHFEVYGVPVFWTPVMAIPDGQEKQKSGFLTPSFGYRSSLGGILTSNYYWAIAPDRDATTGVMITTDKAPVALASYRQRFDNGIMHVSGSTTYSDRTASDNGVEVEKNDQWRGHLFADGTWDINDKWRAGANLQLTSDEQYLREYDINHDDVLENQIYAERFSGRDYTQARLLAFQDLRVIADRTDQPDVLPQIEVNMIGDPNAALGGRWNLDLSMLGLQRKGDQQDMDRFVTQAGWQKRLVSDFGLVSTIETGVRGDLYYVDDHDPSAVIPGSVSGTSTVGAKSRIFPYMQTTSSYPLAKAYNTMQAVIEPIAGLTVAPTNHVNTGEIPNEDSQDVGVTAQNLFDPDRFPGLDRIEDGSRVTYGLRNGLYGYDGSYGSIFLGQSTRLNPADNPFPQGSGLSGNSSDVVGEITAVYNQKFGLNYGFELNNDNLSPERHEISGFANWAHFRLNSRYVYTKALENTDIDESRQQMENNVSYDLTHEWRVRAGAINDLGQNPGLRKATAGIDYFGCCLSFSISAQRSLTTDTSGDSGTSVTFRIGLKGLGGFDTPEKIDQQTDDLWR